MRSLLVCIMLILAYTAVTEGGLVTKALLTKSAFALIKPKIIGIAVAKKLAGTAFVKGAIGASIVGAGANVVPLLIAAKLGAGAGALGAGALGAGALGAGTFGANALGAGALGAGALGAGALGAGALGAGALGAGALGAGALAASALGAGALGAGALAADLFESRNNRRNFG